MSKNKKWKKIELPQRENSVFWIPEHELDEIEGTFVGFTEGPFGPTGTLKLKDGNEKMLPCNVRLNALLEQVKEGSRIKIVFLGWTKLASGRKAKDYNVFIEE